MIYKESASPFNEEKIRSARLFPSSPKGFSSLGHVSRREQRRFVFHSLIVEQMKSGLDPRISTVTDGAQPDSDEWDVLSEQDIFILIILPSEMPRSAASQLSTHRTGPLNSLEMCSIISNSNFSRHFSLASSIKSRSMRLVILHLNPKVNAMFPSCSRTFDGFWNREGACVEWPCCLLHGNFCCSLEDVRRLKDKGDHHPYFHVL